jgi:hypothetical protein
MYLTTFQFEKQHHAHTQFSKLIFHFNNINRNRAQGPMHDATIHLIVAFNGVSIDVHVQILSSDTLVQTEQIVAVRFKVRCGIERF